MNGPGRSEALPTVRENSVRATIREGVGSDRATTRESAGSDQVTVREGTSSARPLQFRLPPTLEEEYEHESDISNGSQASVLLCRRRSTGQQVAIKVYFATAGTVDPSTIEVLVDADPHHIAPSAFGSADDQQWEIMEYFPRGSLQEVMREHRDPFSKEFVRAFLTDTADALVYLHSRGIVHRDLKPANILVRELDPVDIVLGDFGISARTDGSALLSVRGTWGYAAPEASHGRVSPKGDWFALGLIVFELLTGRHLLADVHNGVLPNDLVLRDAIARGAFDLSTVDDARWRSLFEGLLTRDSDHRWGGEQVADWLRGEDPMVHRATAVDAPRAVTAVGVRAFAFGEVAYDDPAELTLVMSEHWEEAGRRLSGRGRGDLIELLASLGYVRADVDRLLASSRPALLLLALQREFVPDRVPTFRGVDLDSASLTAAAQRASGGSLPDGDWIRELREGEVLKALASYQSDGRFAVAQETLYGWWEEVEAESNSLRTRSTSYDAPPVIRAAWEGQLLLAALDPTAIGAITTHARNEVAEGGMPIWTNALVSRFQQSTSAQRSAPFAVVIAAFFPVIRGIERDRLRAEEEAQRERDRLTREAEEARARADAEFQRRATIEKRRGFRRIAWRRFATRLWGVVGYAVLAGFTSSFSATSGVEAGFLATALVGAITGGAAVLFLSLVITLWESVWDRAVPYSRAGLLAASIVCSVAALIPLVRIGPVSLLPPMAWLVPVLILAGGYAATVPLARLRPEGLPALSAQAISSRASAGWMWLPTGLVAVTALGHGIALVITQYGWSIQGALAAAPFGGFLEPYAVWVESWLPAALPDDPVMGLTAATAATVFGLVVPGLSSDLEHRLPHARRVLLTASAAVSTLVVIASPWQLVFAAVFAVVLLAGGLLMMLIAWVIIGALG